MTTQRTFAARLDQSPELGRPPRALRALGSTAQRQMFIDAFPALVQELKLDNYLSSGAARRR